MYEHRNAVPEGTEVLSAHIYGTFQAEGVQELPPLFLRRPGPRLFLPANDDAQHWRLLMVRPHRRDVVVYDSLSSSGGAVPLPDNLRRCLAGWRVHRGPSHTQAQRSNDCALWVLANLEALLALRTDDDVPDPRDATRHLTNPTRMTLRRTQLGALFRPGERPPRPIFCTTD